MIYIHYNVYIDVYSEVYMRTNIVLDDKLIKEAFKYADVASKRELIHLALLEFVRQHKRKDIRKLVGKVKIAHNYDYKKLREDKDN